MQKRGIQPAAFQLQDVSSTPEPQPPWKGQTTNTTLMFCICLDKALQSLPPLPGFKYVVYFSRSIVLP